MPPPSNVAGTPPTTCIARSARRSAAGPGRHVAIFWRPPPTPRACIISSRRPTAIRSVLVAVALGIDLGTTNSCAGVATPTGVEFILGQRNERVHPSVVAFPDSGGVVVGGDAKR